MGRIAKLISTKIEEFIVQTVEAYFGANVTAETFAPSGDDSPPLENDRIVLVQVDGTGNFVSVGVLSKSQGAKPGEKILYSRGSDGEVKAAIKLLNDGKIEMDEGIRIGYVPQYVTHAGTQTVYDFLAEPFVTMQSAADKICEEMATAEDMNAAYQKYQECIDEIEAVDGYNFDTNIRKNLSVAGLDKITDLTVDKISGGEYKLISIIKNMLLKPQLLIMDEPDVFLDFENLVGLAKLINQYEGAILAITHNRLLLNQCFNKVLHLENMELQEFP